MDCQSLTQRRRPKSPQRHPPQWQQTQPRLLGSAGPHQMLSDPGAVTAENRIAPSQHRAIAQNGSESILSCLLLNPQQLPQVAAVTAKVRIAPSQPSSSKDVSNSTFLVCLDQPNTHQLLPHLAAVAACGRIARIDCKPVFKDGSKASLVDWICWTLTSCSRTWLLSPPSVALPQVTQPYITTQHSSLHANMK